MYFKSPNSIILCYTVQKGWASFLDPKCCFIKIIMTDVHKISLKKSIKSKRWAWLTGRNDYCFPSLSPCGWANN